MEDNFTVESLYQLHPKKVRSLIRKGRLRLPTAGMSTGYMQANLIIIPKQYAYDFLLYTQRNPRTYPVIEVSEMGAREFVLSAKESDIARDGTRYSIYEYGQLVGDVESIDRYWRSDLVSFLLGTSYNFDSVLTYSGVNLRHIKEERLPPLYISNIPTVQSGVLGGPIVVSMRPIRRDQLVKTVKVTGLLADAHGAPVHFGDPSFIGIKDIYKPDFGEPIKIEEDEVPVFWASSMTAQLSLNRAKVEFMVTQPFGHQFITDLRLVDRNDILDDIR